MEKNPTLRWWYTIGVFALVMLLVCLGQLFYKPPTVSSSERRTLAAFPELLIESGAGTKVNETFTANFETFALDSFVFRDSFRRLKAFTLWRVFLQKDNNDIYIADGSAAKITRLDENAIVQGAAKIQKVSQLLPADMNVYYSVIPDKGAYLAANHGYPTLDTGRLVTLMQEGLGGMTYIDLTNALSAQSFYATDLHWDQSKLSQVVTALGDAMGFALQDKFASQTLSPFYGVYYGQSALPLSPEVLTYEESLGTKQAIVKILDTKTLALEDSTMYHPDAFTGIDPYNVFLAGAQPLITIENPQAATDRELYLFRDSFGSSLAPLLTSEYKKITLIDLRYMASRLLPQLVEFTPNSDVLFLFSTQILNSSSVLLVN